MIGAQSPAAEIVFDMEEDIRAVRLYANLVRMAGLGMAMGQSPYDGDTISRLGCDMGEITRRLNDAYDKLFAAVHPGAEPEPARRHPAFRQ